MRTLLFLPDDTSKTLPAVVFVSHVFSGQNGQSVFVFTIAAATAAAVIFRYQTIF